MQEGFSVITQGPPPEIKRMSFEQGEKILKEEVIGKKPCLKCDKIALEYLGAFEGCPLHTNNEAHKFQECHENGEPRFPLLHCLACDSYSVLRIDIPGAFLKFHPITQEWALRKIKGLQDEPAPSPKPKITAENIAEIKAALKEFEDLNNATKI